MEKRHGYLKTEQQPKKRHGVSNLNAWSRTTVFHVRKNKFKTDKYYYHCGLRFNEILFFSAWEFDLWLTLWFFSSRNQKIKVCQLCCYATYLMEKLIWLVSYIWIGKNYKWIRNTWWRYTALGFPERGITCPLWETWQTAQGAVTRYSFLEGMDLLSQGGSCESCYCAIQLSFRASPRDSS